jgi:hypothetical protein
MISASGWLFKKKNEFFILLFYARVDCVMLIIHTHVIHVYLKIVGTKIKTLKNMGLKTAK